MTDPSRQLLSAVSANKLEAARAILRKPGVNANMHSCLHRAIFFGHMAMSRLLVEAGADVNARGMAGKDTPLILALTHSRLEIAVFLLERGADPNIPSGSGQFPIAYATTAEMIETLLKYGANLNMTWNKGQNPLFKALYWPTRLKALLQAKADVNVIDKDGYTPLILAAEKGLDAAVQLLLQFDADAKICAPSGRSVYEIATKPSVLQILEVHRLGHFTAPPAEDVKKEATKGPSAPRSPVTEVGPDATGKDDHATKRRSVFGSLLSGTLSKQPDNQHTKQPLPESHSNEIPGKSTNYTNFPSPITTASSAANSRATARVAESIFNSPHNTMTSFPANASHSLPGGASLRSRTGTDESVPISIIPAAAIAIPDTSLYLSTDSQRIDLLEARIQELERVVQSQGKLIQDQGAELTKLLRLVEVKSGGEPTVK